MKILVTGLSGFLGHHVSEEFCKQSNDTIISPGSTTCDLTNSESVDKYFESHKCDAILHMAAIVGGIGLNKKRPADLTHLNLKMIVNLFDAIRKYNIKYFYGLSTVCSYPCHCPVPFKEDDLWAGKSEKTNRGYGEAKRMMITEFQAHKEQYGLKGCIFVPVNLMGEYDHFDLENSHVIPALIRKFTTAVRKNNSTVEVWGSGNPKITREFCYAGDTSQAIVKAILTKLDYPEPINLGTGRDISIKELAETIAKLCGYKREIVFNKDMPDGQPKRRLDVSRAKEVLGWEAKTSLLEGLVKTISWYQDNFEE